ncbi:hypothetical protein RJ640_025518 [Escallonia rubra]|uniref:GAG-pre-integrase domain-containing protein n=1 Tax=Escallonia rubra TaxID=112253 RepID=A0AA88RSD2_9ASTE|nr:hypothetical protein RJ640_025518 [Escallonia rubra]
MIVARSKPDKYSVKDEPVLIHDLGELAVEYSTGWELIRDNNVYSIQLNDLANQDVKCLSAISEASWLRHRRLGHMHMEHLKDISSKELVRGLPKIKFEKDKMNI